MAYELFVQRFPELGRRETRSATVMANNPYGLPADEYGLLEMYCNDENCDCRRVFLEIASRKQQKIIAVVTFGWENEAFYQKWFHKNDTAFSRMAIKEMVGLGLNSGSPQSKYAPAALKLVREILKDENYMARIKRHYMMFKEIIDGRPGLMPIPNDPPGTPLLSDIQFEDDTPNPAPQGSRKRHRPRRSGN